MRSTWNWVTSRTQTPPNPAPTGNRGTCQSCVSQNRRLTQIQAGCGIGLDLPRMAPRELAGSFRKSRPTGSQGGNKLARREDIDNAIWGDPTFEQLSPDAKLLYLWSFTNPFCNMAGLYKASPARMVRETGLPSGREARAASELAVAGLLIRKDEWIWVRSRVKYLRTKSPNMATSIVGDVAQLAPDHALRAAFVEEYRTWPWLVDKGAEAWKALCDETVPRTHEEGFPVSALQKENPDGFANPPGQGKGSLSSTDTSEEKDELDAPERIFAHWQKLLAPNARFTQGRRDKVRARLEYYSAERIIRAIDGCAASKFHVDNNHTDLTLICRSDEKLEQFESMPLEAEKGMRNKDGTVTVVGNARATRDVCRRCPAKITDYEANTQSGMCDGCYTEFEERALA